MRILHVITSLGKVAGTTTFVENVVAGLHKLGHEVNVLTIANDDGSWRQKEYDVVHLHALWTPWLHRIAKWARQRGIPVVWSTHGMTAPWSMRHKWWKKLPAWFLYQKWDLKRAAAIHCTTKLEVEWNNSLGFKDCFVAPLGTCLPAKKLECRVGVRERSDKILLFVGRIYPVKALDRLIEAFARVDTSVRRNWTLRLVGPDQAGHMAELMSLCDRFGIAYSKPDSPSEELEKGAQIHSPAPTLNSNSTRPLVEFAGPKFDQDLDDEYTNCDALALVSHTENFGATVVDAMAHGKPVITSTKTPWKVIADSKCGWWVSNEIESLSAVLIELITISDADRMEMGRRGRQLVFDSYTWSAVCDKMVRGYEEVLNGRA